LIAAERIWIRVVLALVVDTHIEGAAVIVLACAVLNTAILIAKVGEDAASSFAVSALHARV